MPEVPAFSPVVTLLALARSSEASLDEALRPLGLTVRKYGLLGHIHSTASISFSELARRSRITVQSVHSAVASLVGAGMVEDSTSHAGASSTLHITATGRTTFSRAQREVARMDAELSSLHPALTVALESAMQKQFETGTR